MRTLSAFVAYALLANSAPAELPEGISFIPGPTNAVSIESNGKRAVLYGGKGPAELVLLTHARRDLIEAIRPATKSAAQVVASKGSKEHLENAEQFWENFWDARFNYYQQQVNKVPTRSLKVDRYVGDGDSVKWQDLEFHVIDTAGYTRDAVTYLAEIDGKRLAFTGDLLWEGGRVFDLYSFQDAIPAAQIGGYHGYAGRLAQWIANLEKMRAFKPDFIIPARGPLITNPDRDITTAIKRARAIYKNYLSTNALHWYFKAERMTKCGKRVLGQDAEVELMPYSEHIPLPNWCKHMGTTKLLVSKDGHGFALDVGGAGPYKMLRQALADGLIKKVEGIWVTHLHNDHTREVPAAAREFNCPVYAVKEVADGLTNPGAWFLPGIIRDPVDKVIVKKDGESWKWREFTFTSHFFPGQMYNHGGLLVERTDHKPVFFIGDSFSPSGMDDYCLMNRNLMRQDTGYFYCLRKVRNLPVGSWLVNQHIPHLFRFTKKELDYLEGRYQERAKLIGSFVPWGDLNFGIDEEWAWFYPYGSEAKVGEKMEVEVRIANHSEKEQTFELQLNMVPGLELAGKLTKTTIAGRNEGTIKVPLRVTKGTGPGIRVLTANLRSERIAVDHWIETLVRVPD